MSLVLLELGAFSTAFYKSQLDAKSIDYEVVSTDFEPINQLLPGVSQKLKDILKTYFDHSQARTYLIPNITLHECIDHLDMKINLLHPLVFLLQELESRPQKKLCIFGTRHNSNQGYMVDYLKSHQKEILELSEPDLLRIDEMRLAVFQGEDPQKFKEEFQNYVKQYQSYGAQIIVACTELSLIRIDNDHLIDLARLQIQNALKI